MVGAPSGSVMPLVILVSTWPTGALVGAGGATAYYNGVDVTGTVRTLLMGGQLRDMPSWHTSPSNRELDSLYKLVRLQSLPHELAGLQESKVQGIYQDAHAHRGLGSIASVHGIAGGAAIKGCAQAARGDYIHGLQQGVRGSSMPSVDATAPCVNNLCMTFGHACQCLSLPCAHCWAQAGHRAAVHWGGSRSRVHIPQSVQRLAPHRPHVCDALVPQQEPVVRHIRWATCPCHRRGEGSAVWKGS